MKFDDSTKEALGIVFIVFLGIILIFIEYFYKR